MKWRDRITATLFRLGERCARYQQDCGMAEHKRADLSTPVVPKPRARTGSRLPSTIMVVDDQVANRFTIERQLQVLGWPALMADSGAMALTLLAQQPVALILMDCYMPDMDGYATARAIRDQHADTAQQIPIIAISAATDILHQEKCFDSGMDGILEKPLRLQELKKLLTAWLPQDDPALAPVPQEPLKGAALYDLFFQSIRMDAVRMRLACNDRDILLLKHLSHRIKGAAPMFGAQEAAELAHSLESALRLDGVEWHIVQDAVDAVNEVVDCLDVRLMAASSIVG